MLGTHSTGFHAPVAVAPASWPILTEVALIALVRFKLARICRLQGIQQDIHDANECHQHVL